MTPGAGAPFLTGRYRLRLVVRLSAVFALGALLLHGILFAVLSRGISGDYAAAFHALRHFAGFLGPVVALSVLAYALLAGGAAAVVCAFALRRVAGPVYRLERALEECVSGDPVKAVFFRHGDQAHGVAASFNAFLGALREDRQKWIGALEHADRLCLQDQATCRAEMESALAVLDSMLAKYR